MDEITILDVSFKTIYLIWFIFFIATFFGLIYFLSTFFSLRTKKNVNNKKELEKLKTSIYLETEIDYIEDELSAVLSFLKKR
ncbi:hypothetical protein [Spiroplasma endosymbiont of Amphibalanus improvisus]|uniref:hypothetical protein n=1 Tax=Spiroplasma endosymbiont of Amphibalanus improvisus TaxID=3066327 RepID=UPI00313C7E12